MSTPHKCSFKPHCKNCLFQGHWFCPKEQKARSRKCNPFLWEPVYYTILNNLLSGLAGGAIGIMSVEWVGEDPNECTRLILNMHRSVLRSI